MKRILYNYHLLDDRRPERLLVENDIFLSTVKQRKRICIFPFDTNVQSNDK